MGDARTVSRADAIGMRISVALLAAVAAVVIWLAVERVMVVASGGAIPVDVPLDGEAVSLPLGPDGATVEATTSLATVQVTDPAPATLAALYAQPVWISLAVLAGLAVAAAFLLRVSRGRAFERGTARLAYAGAGIVTAGWLVDSILTNMTTNGALAAISDHTYASITFETSLAPVVAVLIIGAVGAALEIGERLQRDTEGLV